MVNLNQATKDRHPKVVTLSETKGLSERFFAALRMTCPMDRSVKCTNVLWSDLDELCRKYLRLPFDGAQDKLH